MEIYENLVIGSGEAGKYLAWTLAREGQRTAVVERDKVGGSCPNIACLPSKNVIHSAKVAAFLRRGEEFGLRACSPGIEMKSVLRRKQRMVDRLAAQHLSRFDTSGAELIMGEAQLIGPRVVQVHLKQGGFRTIAADRVFLNLGTRASIPNVPGLSAARPMTHIEALDLNCVPDHLIVLGGGYVGLELAQAMRRFGARVTVVERGERLVSDEDTDVSAALLELCRDEGIDVVLEANLLRVNGQSGSNVQVIVECPDRCLFLDGSHTLVAAGRSPNTHSIGLDKAGVELDTRGYIAVDDRLRTTAEHVWAMGDCAGSPQFTHAAFDDYRIVHNNLKGGNRTTINRLVPHCMFTDPELVRIGLNESDARRLNVSYRLATLPFDQVMRTRTLSEPRGFMKMLIDTQSDRILGFTAFGAEASELLAAVQTAMLGGMPYTAIRDAIFTHPTIAEGLVFLLSEVKEAGSTYSRPSHSINSDDLYKGILNHVEPASANTM
ncbi:MAG: FAD-dependent oxidoreductase [Bryobacteraceae bacterium]|nr:FAD-dependent oxidoreductase [Bryobacteraceae bacterium]